jgi:hypothetical protein
MARLPELDSITTLSPSSSPACMARVMMAVAGRSLMLPPGFSASSLAKSWKRAPGMTRSSGTRGVLPTAVRTPDSAIDQSGAWADGRAVSSAFDSVMRQALGDAGYRRRITWSQ